MARARTLLVLAGLLAAAAPAAAAPSAHLEGYVPVAAHIQGKFGSFWSTDLWIYTQGATTVHLWYNPENHDNSNVASITVALDEPVVFLPDVVAHLFGTAGKGSLHYAADGPVVVLSKTWTPAEHGGTYGQMTYGIPLGAASMGAYGQAGALRALVNKRAGFRANLGILNVTAAPVTATVEVFDSTGRPAAGFAPMTVALAPFDMRQLDDILAPVAGDASGLVVRVGVSAGNGAVLGYLSEADNTTNSGAYEELYRFGP